MANDLVDVEIEVVGRSEDALLVSDGDRQAWVPISLIGPDSEIDGDSEEGEEGVLWLPEWKALDAGLI